MLINNKSDFKIVEVMDGVQTIPPFKFVYHTDHPTHPYTASYDGIRWKNCKQGATPTSVMVVFDIKGMPIGRGSLRCTRSFYLTDADFQAGVACKVIEDVTCVDLTQGNSDKNDVSIPSEYVYLDYMKGEDGKGISSVVRTSGNGAAGTVDTYTITYTDNTTSTFTVRNGANGSSGSDGYSPIVSVTDITGGKRITITDVNGEHAFDVMNGADGAKGDKGDTGAKGDQGLQGIQGETGAQGAKGEQGIQGVAGADGKGISSVVRTSGNGAAGTVDTYTITYTDNTTSTFTVRNGALKQRAYTLDFGTDSELAQDSNLLGSITINRILTQNVSDLYLSYGSVVRQSVPTSGTVSLQIPDDAILIWEIVRATENEPACVGIQFEILI